jgi:signal transduction histidine kinase
MVTVHDADYNIILANKAAEKILHLPILEKAKDRKCFSYYHGTVHAPEGCPSCGCLQNGVAATFESFEPHLGIFIEIRAIPRFDSDNNLIGLIHVVRDITERKHLEQQVKAHNEQLELLVFERTRALENTNKELVLRREEAEAASRSKTDFLANMSHELRTPLNAIMGFSEIMLMGMAGPVSDKQREFLGDISKSGNHLLSLITDILDLSKVESGKVELEPDQVIVGELVSGSLLLFKEKALKHAVKVESSIDPAVPQIVADRRKLKQVLVNLLSNAFKFTPDGGSVRVETRLIADCGLRIADGPSPQPSMTRGGLSSGEEGSQSEIRNLKSAIHGNFIEFSVADTGHGIEPEQQQLLFRPFQQIDSSLTRKHAGTGLGLSLCRRFIELHGGRIWVESEPGKGSTFRFAVPVRRNERA